MIDKYNKDVTPAIPAVIEKNIPQALKDLDQWCLWRYTWKGTKWTKPPLNEHGARANHATVNLPFKTVVAIHRANPSVGIGFSLRDTDDFCGLDIDNCLDKDQHLLPEFKPLMDDLPDTVVEISPSGQGIRVLGTGKIPNINNSKIAQFEAYSSGRYLTITGNTNGTAGNPLMDLTKYVAKHSKPVSSLRSKVTGIPDIDIEHFTHYKTILERIPYMPNEGYHEWLDVGMIIHYELAGSKRGLEIWTEWSTSSSHYDPYECGQKWLTFKGNKKPLTIGTMLQRTKVYEGEIMAHDLSSQRISAATLLKTKAKPRKFVVEPLFLNESFNMIHAPTGLGKTNFAMSLAACLAEGKDFLKWKIPAKKRILYIDGELSMNGLQRQVQNNAGACDISTITGVFDFITPDLLPNGGMENLTDPLKQAWINRHIADLKPHVIVFDSLLTCFQGTTESQETWESIQAWMIKLRKDGICVILIHHDNKSGKEQAGFSNKTIVMNQIVHLTATPEHDQSTGMMMHFEFMKHRDLIGAEIEVFELGYRTKGGTLNKIEWYWNKENEAQTNSDIEMYRDGHTFAEIAKERGVGVPAISKRFKKYVVDGMISEDELPKPGQYKRKLKGMAVFDKPTSKEDESNK
ncbi:MAG: hypothetical protein DRJ03_02530 [Chloroflexi bacterium]|nr:MAG: hypothetical protein DRJ03_02530 [Chloroflexota bacterium]